MEGEDLALILLMSAQLRANSWDRTNPSGYKLSTIPFQDGEPIAASDNDTSYTDIVANADNSACPQSCFRPVGIAFDSQGRLFFSSDATGEIYVVMKESSSNSASGTATSMPTPTATASTLHAHWWHALAALAIILLLGGYIT